ncbi:MAG: hypothetical protein ABFR75_08600 [Acidobacteriota bacterium]
MKEKNESDLRIEIGNLKKEMAKAGYYSSFNNKLDEIPMKRYIPVDLYLDTDDKSALKKLNKVIKEFLEELDLEISTDPEIFKGSIIQKFWAVTKSISTHMDLVMKIAKSLLSLRAKRTNNMEVTRTDISDASSKLSDTLKLLKNVPNISVRIGSLLMTKSTFKDIPVIQVKNLTKEETIIIDKKPSILNNPRTLYKNLDRKKIENEIRKKMVINL